MASGLSVGTLKDVAEVYDMSPSAVAAWRKSGMPGKPGSWELRTISRWLRSADGPWAPRGVDPLMGDGAGDSPSLERYRSVKADHAELDLAERRGQLLNVAKARDALGRLAQILKRTGERLGQQYGPDATATLNDALDNFRSIVDREFGGRADERP